MSEGMEIKATLAALDMANAMLAHEEAPDAVDDVSIGLRK